MRKTHIKKDNTKTVAGSWHGMCSHLITCVLRKSHTQNAFLLQRSDFFPRFEALRTKILYCRYGALSVDINL